MPYLDSLDIANRALYHLGLPKIQTVGENSDRNTTMSDLYDKVRRAELRRNCWRFSTRRVALRPLTTTSLILNAQPWNSLQVYTPGSMVMDANSQLWESTLAENVGNIPGSSAAWVPYFGPMAVDVWNNPNLFTTGTTSPLQPPNTAYFAGELVYVTGPLPGQFVVFRSRVNSNVDTPNAPYIWNSTTQYSLDDIVQDPVNPNLLWRSIIPINVGITPAPAPASWQSTAVYGQNVTVTGQDGIIYNSTHANNLGHNPVGDGGINWASTNTPAAWVSAIGEFGVIQPANTWMPVFGALLNLTFTYPILTGPNTNNLTRNAYRLPSGFLRRAPDDPKAGSVSYLGAPTGNWYDDWQLEGNFLTTREGDTIVLRFIADVTDVPNFDDMFCEGLAARLAMEACETLTQSTEKLRNISQLYQSHMTEARTVNAIETAPTEPPEDDYITCRI